MSSIFELIGDLYSLALSWSLTRDPPEHVPRAVPIGSSPAAILRQIAEDQRSPGFRLLGEDVLVFRTALLLVDVDRRESTTQILDEVSSAGLREVITEEHVVAGVRRVGGTMPDGSNVELRIVRSTGLVFAACAPERSDLEAMTAVVDTYLSQQVRRDDAGEARTLGEE